MASPLDLHRPTRWDGRTNHQPETRHVSPIVPRRLVAPSTARWAVRRSAPALRVTGAEVGGAHVRLVGRTGRHPGPQAHYPQKERDRCAR